MGHLPRDVLESLAPGGAFYIDYEELLSSSGESASTEAFGRAIEGEWGWLYEDQTRGVRDLRAITIGTFTWLWDATDSPPATEAENRLVGVYGTSASPAERRDKTRMAGFPLLNSEGPTRRHRGHAVGHSLGGPDEGYNLFGQKARVNLGGKWRELERYCAKHPGTFMFVRAIYADDSSTPAALEYGVIRTDGSLEVRLFDNR